MEIIALHFNATLRHNRDVKLSTMA